MVRGLDEGLLGALWNFPAAFGHSRLEAFAHLQEKLTAIVGGLISWGRLSRPVAIRTPGQTARLRHGITYRAIRVDVYSGEVSSNAPANSLRWFPLSRLSGAAVSQLARKIARSSGFL
jgi:hypothetical protein